MLAQHYRIVFLLSALLLICGCGSNETIMPSGELTDAQKAAVAAEVAAVEDEESQGKINQVGKRKK
jgi:hypothetical protein